MLFPENFLTLYSSDKQITEDPLLTSQVKIETQKKKGCKKERILMKN